MNDLYIKHASQFFKIPEEKVTLEQRNFVKEKMLGGLYGTKEVWKPLYPATIIYTDENKHLSEIIKGEDIYMNHLYQVNKRVINNTNLQVGIHLIHLSIKRRDKQAIHDWRHFQYIKNELCGPESCGIEFYPPENILVDAANQYHIWVFDSADYFPFIFQDRIVAESTITGAQQRPWEDGLTPEDVLTKQQIEALLPEKKV